MDYIKLKAGIIICEKFNYDQNFTWNPPPFRHRTDDLAGIARCTPSWLWPMSDLVLVCTNYCANFIISGQNLSIYGESNIQESGEGHRANRFTTANSAHRSRVKWIQEKSCARISVWPHKWSLAETTTDWAIAPHPAMPTIAMAPVKIKQEHRECRKFNNSK